MKKVILLAAVALGAMSAQAQQAVEAPKFFDNWSISLVGGGTTPLLQIDEIGKVRGIAGIEIEKQVTPILALGVEGNWGINTSYGEGVNVFDDQYAGVYGAINLINFSVHANANLNFSKLKQLLVQVGVVTMTKTGMMKTGILVMLLTTTSSLQKLVLT